MFKDTANQNTFILSLSNLVDTKETVLIDIYVHVKFATPEILKTSTILSSSVTSI